MPKGGAPTVPFSGMVVIERSIIPARGRYVIRNFASIVALALAAGPSLAEAESTGQDFTFRRIAAPDSGATRRITVQIDPNAEIYRLTPGSEPRRPGDPRPQAALTMPMLPEDIGPDFSWYWQAVSPDRDADAPLRFRSALSAVRAGGIEVPTPRLQTIQTIADTHAAEILTATIGTRVSPALVLAVIAVESAGRANAVSHAGAEGLMQLMPATAARFGVTDSTDPAQNIRGGVKYLEWLLNEFNRDTVLALAGYNAGEGAVMKHDGVPPYAETRAYVPKVIAAWDIARNLCATPPELPTDGCALTQRRLAQN